MGWRVIDKEEIRAATQITNLELPNKTPVGSVYLTGLKPLVDVPDPHNRPGFFSSIAGGFVETNVEANLIQKAAKSGEWQQAGLQDIPEGWKPMNEEILADMPLSTMKYWGRLLSDDSKTPAQQLLKKQWIMEEIAQEEYMSQGSGIGRFVGWIGGGLISTASLIPLAGQLNFMTKSAGVVSNIARNFPGMLAGSAYVSAARVANMETLELKDWYKETLAGAFLGSLTVGAMGAKAASNIQARGKYLKETLDPDLEFIAKTSTKGEFDGWMVRSVTDDSVGAMKAKNAQILVDEGIDKIGENKVFKKMFSLSPTVRGLVSDSPVVRKFMANLARPSNILTKNMKEGFAEGFSAEQILKGFKAEAYNLERMINEGWQQYVGIKGPLADSRAVIKKIIDGNTLARSQWGEEIAYALRNGDKHTSIPEITGLCADIRKHYSGLYKRAKELDMDFPDLDPITATSYLNRVYNKTKMQADPQGFIDTVAQRMWENSQAVQGWLSPVTALKKQRADLSAQIKTIKKTKGYKNKTAEINKIVRQRRKLLEEIGEQNEIIQTKITEGEIPAILLEQRVRFNEKELAMLEERAVPINQVKDKLKKAIEAKDREAVKKLKEELKFLKLKVKTDVATGRIPKHLVRGKGTLLSAADQVKLRKPFVTKGDAAKTAKRVYDTILQENDEQMIARSFEEMRGTNPLTARSLMVEDNHLHPYLINNVPQLTHMYTNFVGRKIALNEMAKKYRTSGDKLLGEIKLKLKEDFDLSQSKIISKFEGAEREKKILADRKKYEGHVDFVEKAMAVFEGNYNRNNYSPGVRDFLNAARNWTVTTALGALPFIQATEAAMIIKAYGLGPFLKEGLFPMISSVFKGKGLLVAREDLAHAKLAINASLAAFSDQLYGEGSQYLAQGWLGRAFNTAANKFGNFTGANQLIDVMQDISGRLSQSKTIATLKKLKAGQELTEQEIDRLSLLGFSAQEYQYDRGKGMVDRILAQVEEHGTEVDGAFIANYTKWKDFEASEFMLNGIQQEVQSVILTPNYYDVPFAFHDPVVGALTMFWSYGFASTNARLIPLLQRPDAQMIMGEILGMSLAAWVNPLREAVSGREPDTSPKALLASAITNGAPGGVFMDLFNRVNASFDMPFLKEFRTDRYQGKGMGTLFGGALGSLGDNIATAVNMFLSGQISESALRRTLKAVPYASSWWLREQVNAMIEAQGLPKYGKTQGWFFEKQKEFGEAIDDLFGS